MQKPEQSSAVNVSAYLEHHSKFGDAPHCIVLDNFPFRIGRSASAHYIIYSRQVSKEHAEVYRASGSFRVRDLGSTNGTFVNGQRIKDAILCNGDILHISHKEFRFCTAPVPGAHEPDISVTTSAKSDFPVSIVRAGRHLRELLFTQQVSAVFQPIVDLMTRERIGFESLGRGTHGELSTNPSELFLLAGQCSLAGELSRIFRMVAAEKVSHLPDNLLVFLNLHPAEKIDGLLVESLRDIQIDFRGNHRMVLEVNEGMIADVPTLRRLRKGLDEAGIGLAYDDFGAGQSRLAELAEVPPDFIKLDMSLIRGIHEAEARQEMVQALTAVSKQLGVRVVAEGVETEAEAATCLALGCQLGQGFLFGRPLPVTPDAAELSEEPSFAGDTLDLVKR
jgi:EAL domain-containing protein (putative c-di-GMP-specific phosphodiesterase class I)